MEKNPKLWLISIIVILITLGVFFPTGFKNVVKEIFNFEVAQLNTPQTEPTLIDSLETVNYKDISPVYLDSLAGDIPQDLDGPVLPIPKKKKRIKPKVNPTDYPEISGQDEQIDIIFADARKKLGIVPIKKKRDTIRLRNCIVKYE